MKIKRIIKTAVLILPFLVMAFMLASHILTLTGIMPLVEYKYEPLTITRAAVLNTGYIGYEWLTTLLRNSVYVFCAILGIGSIKNKWVRMIILFIVGMTVILSASDYVIVFVILAAFLFPEQTGIKHALRAVCIFAALSLTTAVLSSVSVGNYYSLYTSVGGIEKSLTIYAVQCAVAVVAGTIGALLLIRIQKHSFFPERSLPIYKAGNILPIVLTVAIVVVLVNINMNISYRNVDVRECSLSFNVVIFGILMIAAAMIAAMLAQTLAYSMNNKAVFAASCIMLALSFSNIYVSIIPIDFITVNSMIFEFVWYMLYIAVILQSFGKGRDIRGNIPSLTAVSIPVMYIAANRHIITMMENDNVLNYAANDALYQYGRSVSGARIFVAVCGVVLICIGIAIATAMIKKSDK